MRMFIISPLSLDTTPSSVGTASPSRVSRNRPSTTTRTPQRSPGAPILDPRPSSPLRPARAPLAHDPSTRLAPSSRPALRVRNTPQCRGYERSCPNPHLRSRAPITSYSRNCSVGSTVSRKGAGLRRGAASPRGKRLSPRPLQRGAHRNSRYSRPLPLQQPNPHPPGLRLLPSSTSPRPLPHTPLNQVPRPLRQRPSQNRNPRSL